MKENDNYLELFKIIKKKLIDAIPKHIFSENIIYEDLVLGLNNNFSNKIKLKTYDKNIEDECIKFINFFPYRIYIKNKKISISNSKDHESFLTKYSNSLIDFVHKYTEIEKEDIFISELRMNTENNYFEIDILYSNFNNLNISADKPLTISINKDNIILNKNIKCSSVVFRKLFYINNFSGNKFYKDAVNNLKNSKHDFVDQYINLLKIEAY